MLKGSALVSVESIKAFPPIDYGLQYNISGTTEPKRELLEQAKCFDEVSLNYRQSTSGATRVDPCP